MEQNKGIELSRRTFLGIGGVAAAALAAGTLAGCSQPSGSSESRTNGAVSTDYKAKPEPIADADIAETIEADIVVIGGGISGACAAATAAKGCNGAFAWFRRCGMELKSSTGAGC